MGTCPRCGAGHDVGARFCPSCGAPLIATCERCGATLAPTNVFCSHCGERVARSTASPAAPVRTGKPLLATGGEERKLVTVLFADVAGSTMLADHLDPEQLREVLQRYFDAMREEIEAEGGTVEKFIGDAVMAAFGVPTAHEDDPSRALRAADAMWRRLEKVNASLAISHGLTLQMRIGVNTGEVLAATMPQPGAAMATGDAVNVAARLQTSAEPGEALVSERTARAARGFTFAARGSLDLRGRREPVRAYVVTGRVGGPTRGVPYFAAPMVGRSGELAVFDSIYSRTVDEGRPHSVTVYGDAGVGKSRLVREFLDRVQDALPAPLVLRGRCLPYGDGVTFWPLSEMLKSYAGIQDTDNTTEALAKVNAATATLQDTAENAGADPERLAALLAYTIGLPDPRAPTTGIDPLEVRRRVHLAWREFFTALATSGPVVLLVEDIHWADPALLDLLDDLGERTQGPVLFVYPSRPDLVATRPSWGGGRRNSVAVSLDPLAPHDAEHLVRLLLSVDDLPASAHARILEAAEGNPFFLEEILCRLVDEGALVRDNERWRSAPGIEAIELPDSVQGVLASRIDLLAPADKHVLQAAAVVGRVFWREPLLLLASGLLDGEPTALALSDSIRRLEERELVTSRVGSAFADQPEYIFKHILTRDVAYDSIPHRDLGPAHAQVALWLERTAGERAGEFGELLAHHYSKAVALAEQSGAADPSLRASAMRWLLQSSEEALRKHALDKAERLAQDALTLAKGEVDQCEALTALGGIAVAGARGDLAWQFFGTAAAVADASAEIPDIRAAFLIARACDQPVRWPGSMSLRVPEPEVRTLRDHGLVLAGPGDSRERAYLLALGALWPFSYPNDSAEPVEENVAQGLEGVEVALRIGDADLASGCYDAAAAAYVAVGDYRSSIRIWHRRWELRDRVTGEGELTDVYSMGAWESWEIGNYEDAARFAPELEGRAQNFGVGHAWAWRIAALFRLGRWDDALADFAVALDRMGNRRDSPPNFCTHMYGAAALIHELRGERSAADSLATVLQGLDEHGVRPYGWRIQLALQRGELSRARLLLAAPPTSWRIHAGIVWEVRCDAVLAGAEWQRAAEVAAGARDYAASAGTPSVTPVANRLDGVAAMAGGDVGRAVELLAAARQGFDDLQMIWEAARTRRLLAVALTRAGRADEAADEQATAGHVQRALGVVNDRVIDTTLSVI